MVAIMTALAGLGGLNVGKTLGIIPGGGDDGGLSLSTKFFIFLGIVIFGGVFIYVLINKLGGSSSTPAVRYARMPRYY